jgi:proliferating cell nuclear antigen
MALIARTTTPREWKIVAATIQTLVDEATFEATTEGLSFRAMDPSHVALVDLFWPNTAFEKYDCSGETKFSIRVDEFVKLIRRAENRDHVEIEIKDDESLLAIRFENGFKREFKLNLIESTLSSTPLPRLSFNVRMNLREDIFERILKDLSIVSDNLIVESTKDKVIFTGKGDTGTGSATLLAGSEDLPELDVKEDSKATYTISYLESIVKAAKSGTNTIIFEYSSRMPLRLEFKLGDQGGRIHFYLAPRVDER